MTTIKKEKKGEFWFAGRFSELRNPNYTQATVLEGLFRELLQRIQALEQELDALKSSPGTRSDIIKSGTAADIALPVSSIKKPIKKRHPDIIDDESL
jgi:hypothetical protein